MRARRPTRPKRPHRSTTAARHGSSRSCSRRPGSSAPRWRRTCRSCCRPAARRLATAVAVGALIGPAQVGGRLLEFGVLRRVHPLLSARLAALMHPVGAVVLTLAGAPAAVLFAVLHGAGNGILTIAKGTLPLALFGAAGLRPSPGPADGAGAHRAGALAVAVRDLPRALGRRLAVAVGRPRAAGVPRAARIAEAGRGGRAAACRIGSGRRRR